MKRLFATALLLTCMHFSTPAHADAQERYDDETERLILDTDADCDFLFEDDFWGRSDCHATQREWMRLLNIKRRAYQELKLKKLIQRGQK